MLSIDQLSLGYDQRIIVQPVSHQFTPGKIYALIGPNGSGKSTLLRGLAGYIAPRTGSVTLDGKFMQEWGARERAKRLAFLSQTPQAPDGMNVEQLVASGRYPHQRYWSGNSAADQAILTQAMTATELMDYKDMPLFSLSGGERQRAWIAMTLAQQARILLLDEPTTYLDVRHQLDILNLLHGLSRQYGLTIIMVLHDINQACEYADELLVMQDGHLHSHGRPSDVMSLSLLREVFGIEARKIILPSEQTDIPCFIPTRSVL